MKKFISLTLAVMLVMVSAGYVFADYQQSRGQDARIKIKTYTASSTAQDASGTLVRGTNRILGFTVGGSGATAAGIYDTTSAANVNAGTGMVTEGYCAAGTATTIMFPTPYDSWSNTLYVLVIASDGAITIYYE